ncbi:ATP-binding protein [Oscillibacter sp.]|uniref:sensor histidine kinase n=1 Tax=Oscillibacter sp. TaxID=1945593 RepID=UPI00289F973B|nr:ATP-binding protein [Oscillibacter sp.]
MDIYFMQSYFWEIFVCLIEALLITYLLYQKIGLNARSKIRLFLSVGVLTCILSLFTFLEISSGLRILLDFSACVLAAFWIFNGLHRAMWYKAVLWPGIYFLIVALADNITFSVAEAMVGASFEKLMEFGDARIQFTLVYLFLMAAMVWVAAHLGEPDPAFPLAVTVVLFAILSIGIFAEESILDLSLVLGTNPATAAEARKLTVLCYILLLILFTLLVTFEWLGVILRKNRELQQKQQLTLAEQQQYDLMVSTSESLSEWKHDYQGQLRLISALIEQEKYAELKQFCEQLDSALPASACILCSGNRTIDAVISLRIMEARRHSIRFDTELYLPNEIPLKDVTFASLVGNLLDNAIEACRKIPENTAIQFKIRPWKQMMYLFCSNSSDGAYLQGTQGSLLSTKKEDHHGIGIRRIREIVEQAGGTCQFQAEKDHFNVSIMIPLEDAK